MGEPFVAAVVHGLPGRAVTVYAVDYPADASQEYERGTADVLEHVRAQHAECPRTRFVLGGYSQGALVVSAAVGAPLRGAPGEADLALLDRTVAAVVVFGSPLGARGLPLDGIPARFGPRVRAFCASRDTGCGGRGPLPGSHRDYPSNGSTDEAAAFVLARVTI